MIDYKKMYFELLHATEDVIRRLTQAQLDAEELYLTAEDEQEEGASKT